MENDPRLEAYLDLLFAWNRAAGLTAFRSRREVLERGVAPSRLALPFLPEEGRVLDVGSGGGIPALPLALARPRLSWVLAEPAPAKAVFLEEVARRLNLAWEVRARPAEEVLRSGERWCAATLRGVFPRKGTFRRLASALEPGGALLVWTGGARLEACREIFGGLGLAAEEHPCPGAGVVLLAGRVPRGTSGR